MNVIDRPDQIFGLNCTTGICLSVMQVDSSGKISDLRKLNINFDHICFTQHTAKVRCFKKLLFMARTSNC